jgi:HEAT repeat protein
MLVSLARQGGEAKLHALQVLAKARPSDPAVEQLLRDSLRSGSYDEARIAVDALSQLGTSEARDALIAALGNSDDDIATAAATALGKFRVTGEAASALRSAAIAHPALAPQIMEQLLRAGAPAGMQLAEAAIGGGDVTAAQRAITALENAATPGALDVLARGARSANSSIREAAVRSLGATGNARAIDAVAAALRDDESDVRRAASRALQSIGTPRARDLLIDLSRSTRVEDRYAAVQSLYSFGDDTATRRLADLARDPVPYIARYAISDRGQGDTTLRAIVFDRSRSRDIRIYAASVMSTLDPAAQAIVDQLSVMSEESGY